MGRKFGTEVGVNSSFVALIATESVSIALSWLLLPPEVGVNRHGPFPWPLLPPEVGVNRHGPFPWPLLPPEV